MKTIKMMALPFTFLAAITLGGCVGADPIEGDGALEVQAELESVQSGAMDLDLKEAANSSPKLAMFEGKLIDLSTGRGEAHACLMLDQDVVECFRTKAELDAKVAEVSQVRDSVERGAVSAPDSLASGNCSTPVCLYQFENFQGDVVCAFAKAVEINLDGFLDFDNRTSSYEVGACSVTFWQFLSNTGEKFVKRPFSTASQMGTWDNRVSSIWIWQSG